MKTILLDLDGVLNEYNGDYNCNYIPSIRSGAKEFVEKLAQRFDVKLFTTRPKKLAQKWLFENGLNNYISEVTNIKKPAWLIIDDRCMQFNGDYSAMYDLIENFGVWYKDN